MSVSNDRLSELGRLLDPVALLDVFLDVFEGPVAILDRASRILFVNRAAERVSGCARKKMRGRLFTHVFCGVAEERAAFQAALEARLQGQPSGRHIECRYAAEEEKGRVVRWTITNLNAQAAGRADAGPFEKGAAPRGLLALGVVAAQSRKLERLRKLEYEMIGTEEKLRRQFGQELHDTLASHLAGTAMLSASIARKVEKGERSEVDRLRELTGLIREAMDQVRALSHSFVAAELEADNLAAALKRLAERAESIWQARCTCRAEEQAVARAPTGEVALHLCRIAQEAVRNAMIHADPSRVEMALAVRTDPAKGAVFVLEVRDDGRGMPEAVEEGVGLRGMRRRARLAGGTLEVAAAEDGGTCVRCSLPLERATP